MTPELKQMADLLGRLQEQQAKAGGAASLDAFGDVLGEISTALGDIVSLMETNAKATIARQKADDAREAAGQQATARALSVALAEAMAKLKVESKPDVKVQIASVQVPAITVPAINAPAINVPSARVVVEMDMSKMPAAQVSLLPAPPLPPMRTTVKVERDSNGFITSLAVTKAPMRGADS